MIKISGLHKYFNRGKSNELHVINDVSLTLPERGMIAVFGRSGCGKTTLLNVIGGLDSYRSGSLTVDGKEIRTDPDGIRCRLMGYIFQNYNLQSGVSCFENIASALYLSGMRDRDEVARRVRAALRSVGMEKFEKRPPETLSGGQQQRIAIARAIVKGPRIILADEPTGNLDEANTVMIMDLLRELANEYLVLLVTHEERLAFSYCDQIVELSDGRLVSVRENTAEGASVRSKNDIWLGEMTKSETSEEGLHVIRYGEGVDREIRLRIIPHGGKTYLKIDSPDVSVLDETSEIRLHEGCFEEKKDGKRWQRIDTASLAPFEGKRYGRLYGLREALLGSLAAFSGKKRGKRLLTACMCLFSAALVLMTATFGTAFRELREIERSYHHAVYYVYDEGGAVTAALAEAPASAAILERRLAGKGSPDAQRRIVFATDFFETFTDYGAREAAAYAVLLGEDALVGMPTVCGKSTALTESEIVITSAVAEEILKSSPLSFLDEPRDLLGLAMTEPLSGLRIAGVVRSSEPAAFLHRSVSARLALEDIPLRAELGSAYGKSPRDGCVILALRDGDIGAYPKAGETVKLHGSSFTVERVLSYAATYGEWLRINGVAPLTLTEFMHGKLLLDYPEITPESENYDIALSDCLDRYFYEYADAYTARIGEYLSEQLFFSPTLHAWLFAEKGIAEAVISKISVCDGDELLLARRYKAEHGRYPTQSEVRDGGVLRSYPLPSDALLQAEKLYADEFFASSQNHYWDSAYLVSDTDYAKLAEGLGETDPTALYPFYAEDEGGGSYIRIVSGDPERTEAYLKRTFPALWSAEAEDDGFKPVVTPSDMRGGLLRDTAGSIAADLIALAVSLGVMSLAVYLIMRSSLLARVKEIGILRAIGTSRRNLVFRFLVEAAALTSVSALPGYLVTSLLLSLGSGGGSMLGSMLYYPLPLALALLALLYGVCLTAGILPVLLLTRKTPSEILAKYDI